MGKAFALIFFLLLIFAAFPSSAQAMDDGKAQSGIASAQPPPRMGQQLYETIQKVADWLKRKDEVGPNVGIYPDDPKEVVLAFEHVRATDFPAVEDFARTAKSPWERQVAYYVLITQPVAEGDVELSIKYLDRLRKEFPSSLILQSFSEEDLSNLERINQESKRFLAQKLPKDEELWRLATVFHEGFQIHYALSLLQRIVDEYPKSPWADNAEYGLIKWGDTRDCCADLELIPVFEAFIKKYPDSEIVPKARLDIASEYKDFVEWGDELGNSATGEQVWEYLEKARQIVSDVLKKYPAKQTSSGTRDFLSDIQCMLEGRALQLNIRLSKESWILGEPIEVTAELVNIAPIDIKIQIDPTPPNFTLGVSDAVGNPITFRANPAKQISDRYKPSDWLLIDNGGKYSERCILQENCLSNNAPRIEVIRSVGGFTLDKAGHYRLYARYRNIATGCYAESVRVPFIIGP